MQANSVLILVVVLTIGASEAVSKSPSSNLAEWLKNPNLNDVQKEALINAAAKGIEAYVRGFLNRTRTLCDEIIASDHYDTDNALKVAEGRSNSDGEPIIDKVRRILHEGLPSKNVPPLDPFTYKSLPPINLNIEDVLQIKLQLSNGSFNGLADFEDDIPDPEIKFSVIPPSLTVNVTFDVVEPDLQFITGYDLDAITQDLDIWGVGNLTINLFSLRVNGALAVKSYGVATQVNPCRINVTGRSSKVELTGLLGGGVTSQLVGEIFTDLVNENIDTVLSAVSQLVETELCTYIRAVKTSEWIKLLQYLKKITMMPMPPTT